MISIHNEYLTVKFKELGAEMVSVVDNATGHEFMWQGNPDKWSGQSPVLFPFIGRLKEDTYYVDNQAYQLPRHGFARRHEFNVQCACDNSVTFNLKNNEETFEHYPFEFSLQISYTLVDRQITISYEVLNPSESKTLYYNIGGHPGFNMAQGADGEFDQVYAKLEPAGHLLRFALDSKTGLVDRASAKYFEFDEIALTHKHFKKDAMLFQCHNRMSLVLESRSKGVKITLNPTSIPYVALWSTYPVKSEFVCIEPWVGLPDDTTSDQQLTNKFGILSVAPKQIQINDYSITFDIQP